MAIAFNRLVPAWLFRCCPNQIFRLQKIREDQASNEPTEVDSYNFEVRWLLDQSTVSEAQLLSGVTNIPNDEPEQFAENSNYRVCGAFVGEELVAVAWLADGSFPEIELGLCIKLDVHQSWLFSSYVAPSFRRQKIYHRILRFIDREIKADSPKAELVFAVNPHNKQSMSAHLRLGAVRSVNCFACRIVNWAWCRKSRNHSTRTDSMSVTLSPTWTWNCRKNPLVAHFKSSSKD